MFQHIQFQYSRLVDGSYLDYYLLEDSNFSLYVSVKADLPTRRAAALIKGYSCKNLNHLVPSNLALYFTKQCKSNPSAEFEYSLNKYFPELEYSTKYRDCFLRHMKHLEFAGFKINV